MYDNITMRIKSKIVVTLLIAIAFIISISFNLNMWGSAASLQESVNHIIRTHRIPYCNIALMHDGTVEYESHTLNGEELTPKNLYLSGGVTEVLTGISLNLLFEEGILSPDDTVSKFYPWLTFYFENKPAEITIRQLASHSSGIPFHTQDELFGDDYDGKLRAAMHGISGSNLDFLPGTAYKRIQTNYAVLAFIIEKVTGTSWSQYVTENVIKPLGLTNTYIGYEDVPETSKLTKGSRTCAFLLLDYEIKLNGANSPSKGMLTCAEDLVRLIGILSGETAVPQSYEHSEKLSKAVEMLLSNEFCAFSPEKNGSDAFFGGIYFAKEQNSFYMNGEMENFSTSIWFNTAKKQGVIVQCSGMKAPASKILENCRKELDEKDDFLLSFTSTETLNILSTFLCIVIIYICILNIVAINMPKKKSYSKIRSGTGVILTLLYMVLTALYPFYFDCTYRLIFADSVLMVTVSMGLNQISGILTLCRLFKNRSGANKKAGYMTASGSYF